MDAAPHLLHLAEEKKGTEILLVSQGRLYLDLANAEPQAFPPQSPSL